MNERHGSIPHSPALHGGWVGEGIRRFFKSHWLVSLCDDRTEFQGDEESTVMMMSLRRRDPLPLAGMPGMQKINSLFLFLLR